MTIGISSWADSVAPLMPEVNAHEELHDQLQPLRSPDGTYDSGAKSLVHRGRRGTFRAGSRYIFSALSNGGYDDTERPDGITYLFPHSHQRSLDALDIQAAENCQRDHVPLFYVQRVAIGPARYRIFYPAWIDHIDDQAQTIFIRFERGSQV